MNNTPTQAREIVAQALESGEYTQGHGCLEHRDKTGVINCCLGVSIREFMKCEQHSIVSKRTSTEGGGISFDDCVGNLPKEVQTWLGFDNSFGRYSNTSLANVNDNQMSFPEIAKLFRNPPEGLLAQ